MKKATDDLTEIIIVRLNIVSDATVVQEILKNMTEVFRQPLHQLRSVMFYRSSLVENEWAIVLRCPSIEKDGKSDLAVSLTESLRRIGLVHHMVWKTFDVCDVG